MSNLEDFFTGGGGEVGIWSAFHPDGLWKNGEVGLPDGFNDDGTDSITFPAQSSSTTTLIYSGGGAFGSWTLALAEIETLFNLTAGIFTAVAAQGGWSTFRMDSVNKLLHVCMFSQSDNPIAPQNRLWIFSIDGDRNIVKITADAGVVATMSTIKIWGWNQVSSDSAPGLWRAAEGSGNFFWRAFGTIIEISDTTGLLVSTSTGADHPGYFTSNAGVIFTKTATTKSANQGYLPRFHLERLDSISNKDNITDYVIQDTFGLPQNLGDFTMTFLEWNDQLFVGVAGDSSESYTRFDRQTFDDDVTPTAIS